MAPDTYDHAPGRVRSLLLRRYLVRNIASLRRGDFIDRGTVVRSLWSDLLPPLPDPDRQHKPEARLSKRKLKNQAALQSIFEELAARVNGRFAGVRSGIIFSWSVLLAGALQVSVWPLLNAALADNVAITLTRGPAAGSFARAGTRSWVCCSRPCW